MHRLAVSLTFALLAIVAAHPSQDGAPPTPAAQRDSLFTPEQAEEGQRLFRRRCSGCHTLDGSPGAAPALFGPGFERSWRHPDATVADLMFLARTTMPPQAPGGLPEQEYEAMVAYILRENGFPAGTGALSAAAENLESARFGFTASVEEGSAPEYLEGPDGLEPTSAGPTQEELLGATDNAADWLYHTHDFTGARYVDLDQIDSGNASELQPACVYQLGVSETFQTGPIVYQGTMYVTTATDTVALDAATCRPRWRHSWEPQDLMLWQNNRGVAIKDGRVVRGTADGYLFALDAATGGLLWARQVAKPSEGETITMAPLLFEDLVLVGPAGSENNIKGWVGAFSLRDGSPVWRFHTVPRPGEPGEETWVSPAGMPMGGGAIWTPFSLDPETGELFVAVTNPAPDLPVHLRRGDNLYTNSIVALDVRTGTLQWHRQLIKNDSHDYDLTQVSPLFRTSVNGRNRSLVATVGKDGMLRVLDRGLQEQVYEAAVTTRENAEVPVGTEPQHACPGVLGGVEWNGPAYNPGANLLYVNAVDWCFTFIAAEQVRYIPGKDFMGGTTIPDAEMQGWTTAVNASTGEIAWRYRSDRPMVSAVTTTSGGLVLTGELNGDFIALDATSGAVLYRFNTGGPIGGGVVTYSVDGKQYIAVASGRPSPFWWGPHPGAPTMFVFALP